MSRRHSCPLLASVSGLALGCHVVSLYLGDGFLLYSNSVSEFIMQIIILIPL